MDITTRLARRARDLGQSIDAFWRDLGSRRDDVVVLTMMDLDNLQLKKSINP